ncbi:hypothetical protein A2881_01290 [Candidatus Peribacteria bacterium RIFCSPHIGHO2_01_FULL_55_13]|nr:MAG: hypothetical protein A2881_01290 [Candidatus Peribacteria bacterium RIFCSPHIGHO2_01_FULL_55_13]
MRSSRTLALALISSTHVSLCAGSMLSVLLALLAHTANPALTLTPMTPAIGGSVCLLQTPFDGVQPKTEESACDSGEQCFEHVAFGVHNSDLLVFPTPSIASVMIPSRLESDARTLEQFHISLPVRPPGHSRLFALSAVQRE